MFWLCGLDSLNCSGRKITQSLCILENLLSMLLLLLLLLLLLCHGAYGPIDNSIIALE
eukprot:COSAG02_NODE_606_length_19624_cov_33.479846_14_plen_58_part_00